MQRPWVQPQAVKDYSDSAKVKARTDDQLKVDIARAERYVIFNTHNKFDTEDYATGIPDDVRMAVIILAEAYAKQHILRKEGNVSSETFDDYSYTIDSGTDLENSLGLGLLLSDYVLPANTGNTVMKLRKL